MFGLVPRQTQICLYSKENWNTILEKEKLDKRMTAFFKPKTRKAHILKEGNDHLHQDIFHEYLGHGLLSEFHFLGFPDNELAKYVDDPEKKEREKIRDVLHNRHGTLFKHKEGFANWIESHLCDLFEIYDRIKDKELPEEVTEIYDQLNTIKNTYGAPGVVWHLGFPKIYSKENLCMLVNKYFGEEVDMALVHGSMLPYSDLDIIVTMDKPKFVPKEHKWLDAYVTTPWDFEKRANLLDIFITNGIFAGQAIINSGSLESYRESIKKKYISKEAIEYNSIEGQRHYSVAMNCIPQSPEYRHAMSYYHSYSNNARLLSSGIKTYTLKNLLEATRVRI